MAETWFDLPFYYVFDGKGLVDGAKFENLSIAVQDDAEFRMRAIHNVSSVGRLLNLLDEDGRQVLRSLYGVELSLPVLLPEEIVYRPGSQIRFSLTNINRAFALYSDGITRQYLSKIVFAGVKRFHGSAAEQIKSLYYPPSIERYQLRYYVAGYDYVVNWYGKIAPSWTSDQPGRLFQFEVDDRGLEVYAVQWTSQSGSFVGNNQIEVLPYDLSNRALANDHVPVSILNYAPGLEEQLFPMAPLYWPPQSMVRFGVRSVMTDTSPLFPLSVRLTMFGARRIPC